MELNPTRVGIPYPEAQIRGILARASTHEYEPDPRGPIAAREAVSRDLARRGIRVAPDRILLTASTSEAFGLLFKILADPGDAVLVPRPGYPLFDHLAPLEGLVVAPYDVAPDGAISLPPPSPRVRAVLAVAPHAPTGTMPGAVTSKVPVILDEVFADYITPAQARGGSSAPPPKIDAPLVFRLGGLSKTAGLPGLKAAWIAIQGDPKLALEAADRIETASDAVLSLNAVVARALPELLDLAPKIRERIRSRLAENLALLRASSLAPRLCGTGAAWTIQIRIEGDDEAAALAHLERGVFAHPGYLYDFPEGSPRLVVSLLTPPDRLAAAVPSLTV